MKISKVNHVKFGVAETPIDGGGMLYDYPGKNQGKKDLGDHITNVVSKSQLLYGVFTPNKDKKYDFAYKTAVKFCNDQIISCIKNNMTDKEIYSKICQSGAYAKEIRGVSDAAEHIVNANLKQSLRIKIKGTQIYIPDVFIEVLDALFSDTNYSNCINAVSEEKILGLISAVRKDFTKSEQAEKIQKSIERQNVQVQVNTDGKHLILASALNPKKKYIFDFLCSYAGADTAAREDMLIHMRKLILIYYIGQQILNEIDPDVLSFGLDADRAEQTVSDEINDLLLAKENIPTGDKAGNRAMKDRIAHEVNDYIVSAYQRSMSYKDICDNDEGWVRFISDYASRLLSDKRLTTEKITAGYLCSKTWEEWVSFIAKKYIEMGKGTYNFVMRDIDKVNTGEHVRFEHVDETFADGISGFDYERLKAKDSFKRGLSGYVSFAVNNFEKSIRDRNQKIEDKSEDILFADMTKISLKEDAKKMILRYFGGESSFKGTDIENIDTLDIVSCIKTELATTRNSAFHFVTAEIYGRSSNITEAIFNKEKSCVGAIYRKKYYSNNVLRFYSLNDVNAVMDYLYAVSRNNDDSLAQIPSFNKVLSRNKVADFVAKSLSSGCKQTISAPDTVEIFRSSFYFMLKEIYYFDFIKQQDLLDRFLEALKKNAVRKDAAPKNNHDKQAYEDFLNRINDLQGENMSFGEMCQEIMTEYNLQNSQKKVSPAGIKGEDNKYKAVNDESQKYKHYRSLLYLGLEKAFLDYLEEKSEIYGFLKKPDNKENFAKTISEEAFISGWNVETFNGVGSIISTNRLAAGWYITAHLLDQKNLNHLIGEIKNYIQFIKDIERRAKLTGNRYFEDYKEIEKIYLEILQVLEFTKLFCGAVSNKIEDYFADKDEYAKYMALYVDYKGDDAAYLQAFCDKTDGADYYDGMHPVPNRNVILSSLYGDSNILSNAMARVTEKEIKQFAKSKDRVCSLMAIGKANSEDDFKQIKRYQNTKNRIELVDVLIMTELLNDLYGQLIGYSYLRERDLMYMQLGFYYVKLYYTDSIAPDSYLRRLVGDCQIDDGAILYQIAALYSYGMPLYGIDRDKQAVRLNENVETGTKLMRQFIAKYCDGNEQPYLEGLFFFEEVDTRHDEYSNFRNYIDHFKYFAHTERSILDMYSEMYGGFFSYDIKLKKSVSYILPNILQSYFVTTTLDFGKKDICFREGEFTTTDIRIKNISSDCFMYNYKYKDKDEKNKIGQYKIQARTNIFLDEVKSMLEYKRV